MKLNIQGKSVWINYHHLYCFYVVVREGGLTKASESLGIGQSALSIQMKQFEEQIGFPLFERAHKKIQPNEQGKLVFSYAKEIFRLGNEMVESLFDQPSSKRTHLQIGALDIIPKHFTVELVQQALRLRSCSISVLEGKPSELLKDLAEHRLDLVIMNSFPQSQPGQIQARRIAKTPLWVVGGQKFSKLKKNYPASLDGQPIIVPTSDSHVRHEIQNYFSQRSIHPDFQIETQDVMVQKLLALREFGMTIMPEFAVREYLERKELFQIGTMEGVHEEIFLVSATRTIENPLTQQIIKTFKIS